jgi:hypothetical protein
MSDQSRPHSSSEPAHIAEMRHEKYRLWYYNGDYVTKLSGAKRFPIPICASLKEMSWVTGKNLAGL